MSYDSSHGRSEFDPKYKGGVWASRIDTQDKVAAIVAVEALGGTLELVPQDLTRKNGRIAFEAREDFEIRWSGGRQYVSVKDRLVGRDDLYEAIHNLGVFQSEVGDTESQSMRLEAASLARNARTFYEDIKRLRDIRAPTITDDYKAAACDFASEYGLPADYAELLVVSERRIGENPQVANAMFAHAMRNAIAVHNYGDTELVELFEKLSRSLFYDRRRARGVLDLQDLERMLLAPLVPLHIAAYQVEYVRTKYGYVRDRKRDAELKKERRLVLGFARELMREWRKKTLRIRLVNSILREPIACLACGHPLMANFYGRNGLACPDCGYQPYLTLFYACDCGRGAVVQKQPDLSSFELVRDAITALRGDEVICMGCGRRPPDENFIGRLFALRIPYPIEGYSDANLISWRVKLGWKNKWQFKYPGPEDLTAEEALLRTIDSDPEPYEAVPEGEGSG